MSTAAFRATYTVGRGQQADTLLCYPGARSSTASRGFKDAEEVLVLLSRLLPVRPIYFPVTAESFPVTRLPELAGNRLIQQTFFAVGPVGLGEKRQQSRLFSRLHANLPRRSRPPPGLG